MSDARGFERHCDPAQIASFVNALFRYADAASYVSLRAFSQDDKTAPAFLIHPVQLNGDLAALVTAASADAERCSRALTPVVFAPPIATFSNPNRGRTSDLANGLTLSIELDEGDTWAAVDRLTSLIGTPTIVVASGSEWTDPATGQLFPKLHLHWRLSEPTRSPEDHLTLARVRDLAARLVGADPTGKPVVHPLRWPGSWNLKAAPRLARILDNLGSPDSEIHLATVADAIAEAVEAAGIAAGQAGHNGASSPPEANEALLISALAVIPNPDLHYDEWIRFGYAAYRAFGGSEAGREAWQAWSEKSSKYIAGNQATAWHRIGAAIAGTTSGPTIGAGTIFFHAKAHGWTRPVPSLFQSPTPGVGLSADSPTAKPQTLKKPKDQWPAEAFTAASLATLEPYDWVYKRFLVARYFSVLGAPPGTGKSALIVAIAISIATGKALLGGDPPEKRRCWIINLEDPREAILKLVWACCEHYQIEPVELEGWLFVNSGHDRPLTIATLVDGTVMRLPVTDALTKECTTRQIGALFIDPVVDTHRVPENDNVSMNEYCSIWNALAEQANLAVCLSMHFRKGGKGGDPDAIRGASAVIAKARVASTLTPMSQETAKSMGVPDDRRSFYIQLENAKRNLSPPPTKADWLRLESVALVNGDNIQTLAQWSPPSAWEGLSMAEIVEILDQIEAGPEPGEFYSPTRRGRSNDRWVGNLLVDAGRSPVQAVEITNQWLKSGLLMEGVYHSPKTRHEAACVRVEPVKLAQMRGSLGPLPDPF